MSFRRKYLPCVQLLVGVDGHVGAINVVKKKKTWVADVTCPAGGQQRAASQPPPPSSVSADEAVSSSATVPK